MKLSTAGLLTAALSFATISAFAQSNTGSSSTVRGAVYDMENSVTIGHPDLGFEYLGMEEYAGGDYKRAMKYFLDGALYADKASQLSIGLMYLNGQGVEKDPVKAYAWVAISAERKYPRFEETRLQIWNQLNPDQRGKALALEKSLSEQYGDQVAKPRQSRAMHDSWVEIFKHEGHGLIEGSDMYVSQGAAKCESKYTRVCTDIYAKWFWLPDEYFNVRDAMWTGDVDAGLLQSPNKAPGTSGPSNNGSSD
jgi:uncharacterized protein